VVFTGLTRATVTYYLRRFQRDRGVTLISFPQANGDHLGWDETQLDQAFLKQEAEGVAKRLADSSRNGSHVWIVPGDPLANAILVQALNSQFSASVSP
jgi:hypothetical protein